MLYGMVLVDAIREGEIVTLLEEEAREEDLFILREHGGVETQTKPVTEMRARKTPFDAPPKSTAHWHTYEPEYKKNNVVNELIDNFQWEISKARRVRNLSRLQLANVLGVSEEHVKLVENGALPSDDFVLITKLQNYLGINLRRDGKTFNTGSLTASTPASMGPAYLPKISPDKVSLADLQKLKEARDKAKKMTSTVGDLQKPSQNIVGKDIEIIE